MNIILGLNFTFPFSYSLTCVIYHDEKAIRIKPIHNNNNISNNNNNNNKHCQNI